MLRVGSRFNSRLQLLINEVRDDIERTLMPLLEQEYPAYSADASWPERLQAAIEGLLIKWSSRQFRALADRMAGEFVRSALSFAERTQRRSFGIEVFQNSEQLNDYLRAATIQNARLIQSVPERYIENISNTVYSAVRTGVRPEKIAQQLRDEYGVTQRRAKFIARDQAAKVNGEIQKQRQIDAGFRYFKWVDADDSRVRHRHRQIANADVGYGKGIYRWDDLPLSQTGEPIQPGSDYQCRCIARPIRDSAIKKG